MIVTQLRVKNWRNFRSIDINLRERQFIVGPNASGKSNFLDVFRFLRDIAKSDGGGLQKALKDRGGVAKVRCLFARKDTEIGIEVSLGDHSSPIPAWRYALGIKQEARGSRLPFVSYERAWEGENNVLDRPNTDDDTDPARLKQTFLEQVGANFKFRVVGKFFEDVTYLHIVPQLLRYADLIQGRTVENDPFGQGFLERIAKTPDRFRKSRLGTIEEALKIAVPQFQKLEFTRDQDTGRPHLRALYSHWRPDAGWQQEDQFSDGTLRLIALLWSLLDGDSLLLLEEPELSLNAGIVSQLAPLIFKLQRQRKRQVIISTHSDSLLTERGIDGIEVLLFTGDSEGTRVQVASDLAEVRALLEAGFTVGEAVLPRTRPSRPDQLALLFDR